MVRPGDTVEGCSKEEHFVSKVHGILPQERNTDISTSELNQNTFITIIYLLNEMVPVFISWCNCQIDIGLQNDAFFPAMASVAPQSPSDVEPSLHLEWFPS